MKFADFGNNPPCEEAAAQMPSKNPPLLEDTFYVY
jgi:hypothetical protein